MKRVMVVDDEFLVRIGIKSMLNWEELGYPIVCEAVSGKDALEKIPIYQPHIVLTDLIMMPMDGLQLIKTCAAQYPHIKFIVLSNYNDFDKVKAAMKYGAADYLFKLTTSAEELLQLLEEVSGQIDQSASSAPGNDHFLKGNLPFIRQQLIKQAIEHSYGDEKALLQELLALGIQCDFGEAYRVLYLRAIKRAQETQTDKEPMTPNLLETAMENITQEIVAHHYPAQTFPCGNGVFVVVINTCVGEQTGFENKVRQIFLQLNAHAKQYLGVNCQGALSGVYNGLRGLSLAVAEGEKLITNSFLQRTHTLITSHAPADWRPKIDFPPDYSLIQWQRLLELSHYEKAQALITGFAGFCYDHPKLQPRTVRDHLFDFYAAFKLDCHTKGIALDTLLDPYENPLHYAILHYAYLTDIEESFLTILQKTEKENMQCHGKQLRKEIAQAVLHIKSHIADDLSVPKLAAVAHMSESYFSHLFKSETHMGVIEYINGVRVDRAKELLTRTDAKVTDIATSVGIENPNYFTILFKKRVGQTPLEYRNRKIAEN